jgi:DNA polymerase-3 subunit gamma/tau
LRALAVAARGSMRDALSLLDQAIVFSAGKPTLDAVQQMLGSIDSTVLAQLLDAVVDNQAKRVLALADEMAERGHAFSQALRDLASLLHKIALAQGVPEALEQDADAEEVRRLAGRISREQVQMFYQIALHGRDDLALAPDEYAGFTMTLLRMLAFAPELVPAQTNARSAALVATKPLRTSMPPKALVAAQVARMPVVKNEPAQTGIADIDWPELAAKLKLSGLARELALRSELVSREGDHFTLRVPVKALLDAGADARVRAALAEHFGRPVRLSAQVGAISGATAAGRSEAARAVAQKKAEDAIYADPFVRELIEVFGASVDPRSIRPATPES